MIPQVQIPDFAGTLLRGQQMQQQEQMSRLQMLAQQQALDDAQRFNTTLGEIAPQLGTAEGPARLSLLSRLAGAGPQGASLALPMIGQERERAEFARLFGGAPAMPGAPPVVPAMPPAAPAAPAVDGPTDPRARVAEAARRRQAILDNPNLTEAQQAAALAEVSAWLAAPSVPERPGGYRANPGSPEAGTPFAGLPAPSGVVPAILPGGAAPRTATPASAAPAPAGARPAIPGQPSPETFAQAVQLAASGNARAAAFVQTWAPFMRQNEQNPPPTVTLGAGPHGPAGVYRQNRDGTLTRLGEPPPPATTVVNQGETAFDRERGQQLATRVSDWEAAGTRASSTLSRLERFENLNRAFASGALSNVTLSAAQLAQRLGLPEGVLEGLGIGRDQAAAGEGLRSLTSQMLVGLIGSGGFPAQNFSNADREMLERALPSIANTPRGNEIISGILRASAERDREIARAWREWSSSNGEGLDSARRFQIERLPAITERNVIAPLLADLPPPNNSGPPPPPPPPPGFRIVR